jgi:hypothetical protein
MNRLRKIWNWLVILITTEKHQLATELAEKTALYQLSSQRQHPLLAYLKQPLTWKPDVDFTPVEIEQLKAFFASSTCRKLDIAMHNIAMQDLQRAWSAPAAQREFEIGAAQGRLAAWVTAKTFPETLTPKCGQPEDTATGAASLDHLSP